MPRAALKAVPTKEPTVGELIDQLWSVKEEKKEWAKEEKKLNARIEDIEQQLFAKFDAEQMTLGRGSKASISVGTSTAFNIADFDALCAYVKRKNYFHLFQRRVTVESARELFEANGSVPGLEPYTKRTIHITTLK